MSSKQRIEIMIGIGIGLAVGSVICAFYIFMALFA